MVAPDHAGEVAHAFGLGNDVRFTGRISRGEQGRVQELVTSRGSFAVKTSFDRPELDGEDAEFQEVARAAGVSAPAGCRPRKARGMPRSAGCRCGSTSGSTCFHLTRAVDPAGSDVPWPRSTARRSRAEQPEDPWYTDPVGTPAWDALADDLAAAGAPFASDLAAMTDEFVALEALLQRSAKSACATVISGRTTFGRWFPAACA